MKICVFGASGNELDPRYFQQARILGELMAKGGHTLVFGGGNGGLMGACARGAAAEGGEILGIAPRFFDEPGVLFPGCTRLIFTESMRERKYLMEEEAEGFVVLPGGIGTLEEFFETLTLKQLGRHGKPMALLNTLDYYSPLLQLLQNAAEEHFLSSSVLELFSLFSEPAACLEHLLHAGEAPLPQRLADYSK